MDFLVPNEGYSQDSVKSLQLPGHELLNPSGFPNVPLSLREDHHFHRPMKGDAGLEDQSLQAAGQAA